MKFTLLENKTRKATVKKDILCKDGTKILAGTTGTLRAVLPGENPAFAEKYPNRGYTTMAAFHPEGSERDYKIRMSNLPYYFKGFTKPSMRTLEKWTFDEANPKTPVGTVVEPDGVDPDGWPSWMLILGFL
jgi:hypothetical protein